MGRRLCASVFFKEWALLSGVLAEPDGLEVVRKDLYVDLRDPPVPRDTSLFDVESLVLSTRIASEVRLTRLADDFAVQWVSANVSWFPHNDSRQNVLDFVTEPAAKMGKGEMEFFWEEPAGGRFAYSIDATVETKGLPLPVRERIGFPLERLDRSFQSYLEPQPIIDITPEIRSLAQGLAQGHDDLFGVVFALATWVRSNVRYNLTTLTSEAAQPASWVLENREGVCDELTSLFMAMARSLGIPARFVAGVSYTDLPEFEEPWGPHGWAEVYFPGVGWVPVDVTYGQYGFVDATHIKFKETLDAQQATVRYTTKGRSVGLETQPYQIKTEVVERGANRRLDVVASAEILYDEVGPGAFNLLTLALKNREDHYLAFDVQLAQTKGLQNLDELRKSVLLEPRGRAQVAWALQQVGALQTGYLYTYPLEVHALGRVIGSEFRARVGGPRYAQEDLRAHLPAGRAAAPGFALACAGAPAVFVGMDLIVTCETDGADPVCLADACETPAGGVVNFTVKLSETGVHTLTLTRKGRRQTFTAYVTVDVQVPPDVLIEEVSAPETIGYGEEGTLEFLVKPAPNSLPHDLKVAVEHTAVTQTWTAEALDHPTRYRLLFTGDALDLGVNTLTIRVTFADQFGKAYERTESVLIEMKTKLFYQRVMIALKGFWGKVAGWFS